MQSAQKAIAEVEKELEPLRAAYENKRRVQDEINELQKKIGELKEKAKEAERIRDFATASDLRYYMISDLQGRLGQLETQKAAGDDGASGTDTVTPGQIAEAVARWTSN